MPQRTHISDRTSVSESQDSVLTAIHQYGSVIELTEDELRELFQYADISDPSSDTITHSFEVGDYALDDTEPTPSPEANTIEIVELIDARADEHVIEETGKTVAEHNQWYPSDDPVVAGVYPNMSSDDVFHFPESRLRPV